MLLRSRHLDEPQLRQLLASQLPDREESRAATHLETCTRCRQELEGLAAEASWWTDAERFLPGDPSSAAVQPPLAPEPISNTDLTPFLEPSDNPAMLGKLGGYEIVEVIGRGGFGIVLKGYDRDLNRYVAIKVLAPHFAGIGAARQRFAREAQAAAAVVHPHVISIHAVDGQSRLPYLVMPYIAGESLQQRLDREGPLSLEVILRIGRQVADGLAAAHSQGLVHRDVKPANILLERGVDRVVLTDFGLARAADDATLTCSGIVAGTPQYMSPEQARGDTVDPRSDLFSLGSVLYALCAGLPPFRAANPIAILRRICDDRPRPIVEINPRIPAWMGEIISRLHGKTPEGRPTSAAEVSELLQDCLAHVQNPAAAPLPRSLRKNTTWQVWIVAGVSFLSLAMVAGLVSPLLLGKSREDASQGQIPPSPAASPADRDLDWDSQGDSLRNLAQDIAGFESRWRETETSSLAEAGREGIPAPEPERKSKGSP